MNKWEFNVPDLHNMKKCKVEISDRLKWKVKNDTEVKNFVNLAWAIYVRNAPVFFTIPIPEHLIEIVKSKELTIYFDKTKIFIS